MGHEAAQPTPSKDTDGVETGGNEVVLQLRGLSHHRAQVGGEALGSAKELPDPRFQRYWDPLHRPLHIGSHPLPIRLDLPEGEVLRHPIHHPGGTHRLEEADHQSPNFVSVVGVAGRVLEDRHVWRQVVDLFGDEVVVLGGLERNVHPGQFAELPGPHSCAVHNVFGLDVPVGGANPRDPAVLLQDAGGWHVFKNRGPLHPGTLGQSHGDVHRIHDAVFLYVEAGLEATDVGDGKEIFHL